MPECKIRGHIAQLLRDTQSLPKFDLVEVGGLFDYLEDRAARFVIPEVVCQFGEEENHKKSSTHASFRARLPPHRYPRQLGRGGYSPSRPRTILKLPTNSPGRIAPNAHIIATPLSSDARMEFSP